jgi:hypothetical protein
MTMVSRMRLVLQRDVESEGYASSAAGALFGGETQLQKEKDSA